MNKPIRVTAISSGNIKIISPKMNFYFQKQIRIDDHTKYDKKRLPLTTENDCKVMHTLRSHNNMFTETTMENLFGLYIHVPFCVKKCAYCDFFSRKNRGEKDLYIEALLAEMEESKSYISRSNLSTIYFGGGTPSILSIDDFERIFEHIDYCYDRSNCQEITIEANPDDLNDDYVKKLRHLPLNRISMGIQSFQDKELQFISRRHSAQEAIDAVKRCQDNGFENISIDLMYGLPGQSLDSFQANIEQALKLKVQHISAYLLSLEPNVPLYKSLQKGEWQEAGEDLAEDMYRLLCAQLTNAGWEHYEISNFAQKGFRAKHNAAYWHDVPYLGLGPSAHSYNGVSRRWNEASLKNYLRQHFVREEEILDLSSKYNDFVLTRLRTKEGIPLAILKEHFGQKLYDFCLQAAESHIQGKNLLQNDDFLYIPQEAYFISDEIIRDLIKA